MLNVTGWTAVTTQRDTHFTDGLAAGASEYENLQIGQAGEIKGWITSVRLVTATNHIFTIAFYSRDVNHQRLAATPYTAALLGQVTFQAADAWANATEYVYFTDTLRIPYIDEDNTGEIHVGLHNGSTVATPALGATAPAGLTPQYKHLRITMIGGA